MVDSCTQTEGFRAFALEAYTLFINRTQDWAAESTARLHMRMASRSDTPPHVLAALARAEAVSVLERVAENPRTPVDVLEQLARHESAAVRAAVSENENVPGRTLLTLSADEDPDVRFKMAENPRLSPLILRQLAADDNPFVAFRAQKTLLRIKPADVVEMNAPRRKLLCV
ncbi:MAG TPA: hypothetical protein V6D08_11035 [Candidatus Obscuribacterales bacterium]